MIDAADPFANIQITRRDYQSAPLPESFSWADALRPFNECSFYVVAFRSKLAPNANVPLLHAFDAEAHREARRQSGFRHYFIGEINPDDPERCNVSWCAWDSPLEALVNARQPYHTAAMTHGVAMYDEYDLERYLVIKTLAINAGRVTFFEVKHLHAS